MAAFLSSLGFAILTAILSFAVLMLVVNQPPIEHTAQNIEVPGSHRRLSYEIRGDRSQPNAIMWLHGLASSRYELLTVDEEALRGARAYAVCFDRPGYGESTPHKGRSFESSVEDILTVADALKIDKFFVVGVSTGAGYAFAVASMAPARVRGLLTLSAAGPYTMISAEERERDVQLTGGKLGWFRRICRQFPIIMEFLRFTGETYVGGRFYWLSGVEDQVRAVNNRISAPDRKCATTPPSLFTKVLPESVKQGTVTPLGIDLYLLWKPWSFNITEQIPEHLARATQMYHGASDKLVWPAYSQAYKRMLPAASLEIVENAFHFHYWVCEPKRQRAMFKKLVNSGLPA